MFTTIQIINSLSSVDGVIAKTAVKTFTELIHTYYYFLNVMERFNVVKAEKTKYLKKIVFSVELTDFFLKSFVSHKSVSLTIIYNKGYILQATQSNTFVKYYEKLKISAI